MRFYLDGVEYDSPKNWRDTTVDISLDHNSKIVSIDYSTELTWKGAAFNYLYDKAINDNCGLVNVRIDVFEDDVRHEINSVLFLSSMSFNETDRSATGKMEDDTFSARIQNNKNTEVFFGSKESKNGVGISNVPVSRSVFKPSDGVYYADYVNGLTPFRAFEYLIDWMTDKTVEFKSDFFTTGAGKNFFITTAGNLQNRGTDAEHPTYSFKQLFDTFRKLFNLGMGFQRLPNAIGVLTPTVVIEELEFFRDTTNAIVIDDVHTTELSFIQELLYGRIQIGSEIRRPYECDNGNTLCNASNNIFWYGFDTEMYPLAGTCNTDTFLDLSPDGKFVIDTNIIQDILEFEVQGYEKKAVILEMYDGTIQSSMSDPLGLGQRWYNGSLTNKNIINRYTDYLINSISVYGINNSLNQFNVTDASGGYQFQECLVQTPAWVYSGTMPFDTGTPLPQYINNNCFDLATDRFEPEGEGIFKFEFEYDIQDDAKPGTCPITGGANNIHWQLEIHQFNSTGAQIATYSSPLYTSSAGFSGTFIWTTVYISMDEGDYLEMHAKANMDLPPATNQNAIGISNGIWRTIEAFTVVKEGQANAGTKATPKKTITNAHLAIETIFDFLKDTTKTIRLTNQYIGNRNGHLGTVSMNLYTGESEITTNHD